MLMESTNVPSLPEKQEDDIARIDLSRAVVTEPLLHGQPDSKCTFAWFQKRCRTAASECCSPQVCRKSLFSLFPVLTWLPAYKWKTDLLPDFLAGLTVGIMSIPQGMAYARLAGMPPVYGLYTNIIPTFIYFLLGTTKHAAIGPATVLSLITSTIRYKHIPCQDCWLHQSNSTMLSPHNSSHILASEADLSPIELGTAVAFLVGAFLIIMGLFRLSFISDYLPDQLVGGFTVAAAVQVFAGQLQSIFGAPLPNREGIGKVVMNFVDLFAYITQTNVATLIVFACCFIFLLLSKYVVNPRFQPKLKIPFPGELIVVIAATLASYYGYFNRNYSVSVVKHIPAGLPAPIVPKFSIMGKLAADSLVLAIITYTYSISLAKLYAKRNGYRVRASQEFYAYGFMNFVSSFFQCFNSGQIVSRSLVYEMAGARSQLCGMVGSLVVILTVLFIAPFLESLPNAALAAIIVTACIEMLRNLRELPPLFRKSKYDFGIYVVTLTAVIFLDVTYGLALSVAFALITVVLRAQRTRVEPSTEETRKLCVSDSSHPEKALEIEDVTQDSFWTRIRVLKLNSPVFYANIDRVKHQLLDKAIVHPHSNAAIPSVEKVEPAKPEIVTHSPQSVVILDMASVSFMDLMAVNALKDVHTSLKAKAVALYLCGCTAPVVELMKNSGLLDQPDGPFLQIFPTVLDAVYFFRFYLKDHDFLLIDKVI